MTVTLLLAAACTVGASAVRAAHDADAHLYVLGDSWSTGYGADPDATWVQDAARKLDLDPDVDAVNGTGYLNAAGHPEGTYLQRAEQIPTGTRARLVVLQGGSNDVSQDLSQLPAAVQSTIDVVRQRFGSTPIVILGPGLDVLPQPAAYTRVDATLAAVAKRDGIPYISMLGEHWIGSDDFSAVIDPVTDHPSVAGHAYLASRFLADLRRAVPALARTAAPAR